MGAARKPGGAVDLIMYGEARLRDVGASSLQHARARAGEVEIAVHRLVACYPNPSSAERVMLQGLVDGIVALREQLTQREATLMSLPRA
jgi:hypothetical protein